MIEIANHGPRLTATNYWSSAGERAGNFLLSLNADCFHLLVPQCHQATVSEMATAKEVIITRGPLDGQDALEVLFDDGSEEPFVLYLGASQCVPLPDESWVGCEVLFAVYTAPRRGGKPHKSLERVAWYRLADVLPCLKKRDDA